MALLCVIIVILLYRIYFLRLQIKNTTLQLRKRFDEGSHQMITVDLVNPDFCELVKQLNLCLQAEENLRLKVLRDEKDFRVLITNISHDLRTPLTALKGYLQLIDETQLTGEQKQQIDVARHYANQLGDLIEHFFEYAYYINSSVQVNLEPVLFNQLVIELFAGSVPLFEEKGLKVHYIESEEVSVMADKQLLIRVVDNLIRNCLMHAYDSVEVEIMKEEEVTLHVRNGIPEDAQIDIERIFDRFYTQDKARSSSTGLGLSIVKILTESMGGIVGATMNHQQIDIWIQLKKS